MYDMIELKSDGVTHAGGRNCHIEVKINDVGLFYVYPGRSVSRPSAEVREVVYFAVRSRTARHYTERYNFIQASGEKRVEVKVFEVSEFLDGHSPRLEKHITDILNDEDGVVNLLDQLDPPLQHDDPN
ncbi:MAG: hypothetical protein Roseis2KO_01370 [Roseivirga sp.]